MILHTPTYISSSSNKIASMHFGFTKSAEKWNANSSVAEKRYKINSLWIIRPSQTEWRNRGTVLKAWAKISVGVVGELHIFKEN